MSQFIDLFLHLDVQLSNVISTYGVWTYAILFVVLFCETGLVFTPFLPGDSLLFAAGAFAARGSLSLQYLWFLLVVAAILGDSVNYLIGYYAGRKLIARWKGPLLKPEHVTYTQKFYDKHGGKTIVLARFIPIIRTFAPFVAGIAKMSYGYFILYNILGAIAWVTICLGGGYLLGNIPIIKDNFEWVILIVVGLSILPALIRVGQHKYRLYRVKQR